jgi:protein TonB
LGFTACNTKSNNSNTSNSISAKDSNNIESLTECYSPVQDKFSDTIINNSSNKKNKLSNSLTPSYDNEAKARKKDSLKKISSTKAKNELNETIVSFVTCYEVVDVPNITTDSNSIYDIVEQMPEFQGGESEMFKFIGSNIKYPSNIGEVQGRVICRFIVEKDGKIGKIEVVRSVYPDLDKEAVRVIRSMPKWIPGKQNGKTTRVWYTLPINLKLQ